MGAGNQLNDASWLLLFKDFPWAALITALSTLAAVYMTSYLTGRRSAKERLWDLQREAFGEIISSVKEGERMVLRLAQLADAARANPSFNAALTELNKEWLETGAVGRRRASRDGLILPDAFNDAYQRMSERLSLLDRDERSQSERGHEALAIMKGTREELQLLARKHLERRI